MNQNTQEKLSFEETLQTFDGKKTLENMLNVTLEYIKNEQLTPI